VLCVVDCCRGADMQPLTIETLAEQTAALGRREKEWR
jgi:hypothetical protein